MALIHFHGGERVIKDSTSTRCEKMDVSQQPTLGKRGYKLAMVGEVTTLIATGAHHLTISSVAAAIRAQLTPWQEHFVVGFIIITTMTKKV